ncbi:MAG: glycosyltransferase family 4 protein [Victivallales bacterium]|nr:glycosyltransferase family 4 protein [Victivallales bacterium]
MISGSKNILFCLDYYYPHLGGAEVLFTGLAEGLAREGFHVRVLTQKVPGTLDYEVRNGVEINRISSFGNRYVFTLRAITKLLRLVESANIIHATTFASTLPAWFVAKITGIPLVLTVHEVWVGLWKQVSDSGSISNFLNDKIERFIYWFDYQNYVAVSNSTARALLKLGIPQSKVHVIYNGLDYDFWMPHGHDRAAKRASLNLKDHFTFFFSGRPGCSKGLPVLLRAFAEIHKMHPDVRLLALVSRAKAVKKGFQEAEKLIETLHLQDAVILHEPVPPEELPDYVYCADTVVVPSLSEGFGFAAAEACAMHRPVIVTDNASLPEVVSGKVLTIPPNHVEALAYAMERALQDDFQLIPEKRFLLSTNLNQHIALYNSILNQH